MKRLLIILTLAGLPCTPFAQTRLTLDACIEQAEANNKALAAADRQLAAAQFDFRSARANFFPSFSATGTGLYSTADGGLDIAGGALPVLGVDGMPTGGTALFPGLNLAYEVGWVYGGGITLEQPLYMGGKVRTGYRMARIGSEMAEQNRRLTRSEVIVSTSRAYASVIRAREMRQVAERYHALLTELLRSVESARKHGLKPQNDVLKVRVKLNESELNLRRTENALRLATMNLCHLIGRPLTDRIEVADDLPDLPSTPVPAVDLMARPEYRLLDRKAELAREQLRLARSERLPQVGLVGNYGYLHGVELNGQNLLGGWAFTAGVQVSVPIFHFGGRSNKVRSARARFEQAQAERLDGGELLQLEATQAANNLDEAQLEIRLAESSLAAADENLPPPVRGRRGDAVGSSRSAGHVAAGAPDGGRGAYRRLSALVGIPQGGGIARLSGVSFTKNAAVGRSGRCVRFCYSSLMKSARGSWSMLLIATTSMPLGRLAPLGR